MNTGEVIAKLVAGLAIAFLGIMKIDDWVGNRRHDWFTTREISKAESRSTRNRPSMAIGLPRSWQGVAVWVAMVVWLVIGFTLGDLAVNLLMWYYYRALELIYGQAEPEALRGIMSSIV